MTPTTDQFDRQLSHVQEDYLEIIFLEENKKGSVKASAIADQANVSRSSVTSALRTLHAMQLIHYEPYSPITLTPQGRNLGREIYHRHMICQEFFESVLQIEPELADKVACELEHVIPAEVIHRLGQFMLYMQGRRSEWADWQDVYRQKELRKKHIPSCQKQ